MWSPWRWETRTASMSSHVYPPSESAWASPRWEGSPASNSRTVPPCSTSMRFPELPLRSGRTANPLLKGQKLQPGSFVRGSRGADAQNLEDHRFDHDERLAFLPDAPGQDLLPPPERGVQVDRGRAVARGDASHPHDLERIRELTPDRVRGEGGVPGPGHQFSALDRPEKEEPPRNDPFPFTQACERRHYLPPVVKPGEHDLADRSRLIPHRALWGSRGVPGEDEVVPFHVRQMAGETGGMLLLVRRFPVHEPPEPPPSGGGVLLRVLDHEFDPLRLPGDVHLLELGGFYPLPRQLGEDRPVRERKGPGAVCFHGDVVPQDDADFVFVGAVGRCHDRPLPVPLGDRHTEYRGCMFAPRVPRDRQNEGQGQDKGADDRDCHRCATPHGISPFLPFGGIIRLAVLYQHPDSRGTIPLHGRRRAPVVYSASMDSPGRGPVRGDPQGDARLRGLRDTAPKRRSLPGEATSLLLGNRRLAAAVRGDRVRDGGCACGPAHRGGGGGDRGRARKGATP